MWWSLIPFRRCIPKILPRRPVLWDRCVNRGTADAHCEKRCSDDDSGRPRNQGWFFWPGRAVLEHIVDTVLYFEGIPIPAFARYARSRTVSGQ